MIKWGRLRPAPSCPFLLLTHSMRYIASMSPNAKKLLERVSSWPDEDVAELEEMAREIEARRAGVYVLSDEEWAELQDGIAQADRREFVSDDVVAEADKRHGI
jgi:hypothetical protein